MNKLAVLFLGVALFAFASCGKKAATTETPATETTAPAAETTTPAAETTAPADTTKTTPAK